MPFLVSRRSLLRDTALRGVALVSGAGLLRLAASGQNANGRRALALIGDRYHNADYIRVALSKVFEGQGVAVDYTIDYTRLSRSLLSNYQLFLCLRDGMIWPNGYLGPDAYTSYEQGLENREDFPEAKPQTWLTEEQAGVTGASRTPEPRSGALREALRAGSVEDPPSSVSREPLAE